MTLHCARCNREVPTDDINVANDVAYCRGCNQAWKLSELVSGSSLDAPIDLTHPPAGTWVQRTGMGTVIGASHRSIGSALGLLAVSLFWNGIVSIFVTLAASSTFHLLKVPVPGWFPSPRMNGGEMHWGMTLFLWLFLTPFILIGAFMISGFLLALGGRTEVNLRHSEGTIFVGIGAIGWRRRFNTEAVKSVRLQSKRWRDRDGDARNREDILLETLEGKEIRFGSGLPAERRKFLASALKQLFQR